MHTGFCEDTNTLVLSGDAEAIPDDCIKPHFYCRGCLKEWTYEEITEGIQTSSKTFILATNSSQVSERIYRSASSLLDVVEPLDDTSSMK